VQADYDRSASGGVNRVADIMLRGWRQISREIEMHLMAVFHAGKLDRRARGEGTLA